MMSMADIGTHRIERYLLRDALGWLLVTCGVLAFVAYARDGSKVSPDIGYLAGVWARSFTDPYQLVLLGAVIAVPLHFVTSMWRYGKDEAGDAYDRFGAWTQTLLTSLGFLGTVIGISRAVAGLRDAMAEQDPALLIQGLSTAFDTTALGLSGAVFLMLLRKTANMEVTGR